MDCVRSVSYVVKCNSPLSDLFTPKRGLRQGDPLSPYLFLFCMDALSRMFSYAQTNGLLRGIRVCYNCPRINHLFFADDALLFIKNKKTDVEQAVHILHLFKRASG